LEEVGGLLLGEGLPGECCSCHERERRPAEFVGPSEVILDGLIVPFHHGCPKDEAHHVLEDFHDVLLRYRHHHVRHRTPSLV
jgi:hypothetical protein